MKTILDVVKDLRESDPPLTYLRRDESVAYGKFLKSEVVDWNGRTRIVPSYVLKLGYILVESVRRPHATHRLENRDSICRPG